MNSILLAGKDWQSRALLRAQLLEEGFAVEAYDSIAAVLATLDANPALPDLLIADISASDDPSADVAALAVWSAKLPIWIIASRAYILKEGLRGHGFEMTLLRPVDVNELICQVRRRLERET